MDFGHRHVDFQPAGLGRQTFLEGMLQWPRRSAPFRTGHQRRRPTGDQQHDVTDKQRDGVGVASASADVVVQSLVAGGRRFGTSVDAGLCLQFGVVLRCAVGVAHLDVFAHLQRGPPQQPADQADQFDAQRQRIGGPLPRPPQLTGQRVAHFRFAGPSVATDAVVAFLPNGRLSGLGAVQDAVAALNVQPDRPQFALPHLQRVALSVQRGGSGGPSLRSRTGAGRLLLDAVSRPAGPARLGRLERPIAILRLPLDAGGRFDQCAVVAVLVRLPLAPDSARSPAPIRTAAQIAQRFASVPPRTVQRVQSQAPDQDAPLAQSTSPTLAQTGQS